VSIAACATSIEPKRKGKRRSLESFRQRTSQTFESSRRVILFSKTVGFTKKVTLETINKTALATKRSFSAPSERVALGAENSLLVERGLIYTTTGTDTKYNQKQKMVRPKV